MVHLIDPPPSSDPELSQESTVTSPRSPGGLWGSVGGAGGGGGGGGSGGARDT